MMKNKDFEGTANETSYTFNFRYRCFCAVDSCVLISGFRNVTPGIYIKQTIIQTSFYLFAYFITLFQLLRQYAVKWMCICVTLMWTLNTMIAMSC